jgi:hypothetical protein
MTIPRANASVSRVGGKEKRVRKRREGWQVDEGGRRERA